MKRYFTIFVALLFSALIFGQSQWTTINQSRGTSPELEILEQSSSGLTLKLITNAYGFVELETPRGTQFLISSPDFCNSNDKGVPDLAHFARSIIIPNKGIPKLQVLSSEYQVLSEVEIAPSKGNIYRNVNPADVPYEYGDLYDTDVFFPDELAVLSQPFVIRDYRGVSINYNPFIYNAYTKDLKIYSEIILRIDFTNETGENELTRITKPVSDFQTVYQDMFVNYNTSLRYTPLEEGSPGKILVICADAFASTMRKYVNWKREKGIETDLVLMSSIGTTSSQLKTFINQYYNTGDGMTYVLLVGDHEGVPTNILSSSDNSDLDSDNKYAYIVGNDSFVDVFIGRFSGTTLADVKTQVDRTVHYEKALNASDNWLGKCMNSGSNEGTPSDEHHLNAIASFLTTYGYNVTNVHQNGGSILKMNNAFNQGVGLANYTGHGTVDAWSNVDFSNANVKALTNENKLPFIWSVACLNGQFRGRECFAEAWLQSKSNNNNAIGAIAVLASTILQAWIPPMHGQTEMNKLLVSSYNANIKRTIGGISFNGIFKMIELNNNSSGKETADAWELFGDPSLMVRTKTPSEMTLSHAETLQSSATSFAVSSDTEGALAAISKKVDDVVSLLGYAYVVNGSANIPLTEIGDVEQVTLTLTAFDKITKQVYLPVEEGEPSEYYLSVSSMNLSFQAGGGEQSLQITSNVSWSAISSESWLTLSPESGSNNGSIAVSVSTNEGEAERTANITVSGTYDVAPKTILVTQASGENPPGEDEIIHLFTYDFEACTDFALDQFSPCTTHDGDGLPVYGMSDATFPGEKYTAGSYIAFNPFATDPPINSNPLYASHQGNKYGVCFGVLPGEDDNPNTNNDWFITPEIYLQANSKFTFWAKTAKVQYGLERFNVLVSTTTNNISDFTKISSGSYLEAPGQWTEFEFDLSTYDNSSVYVAIQCVSYDSFMFMIDELDITSSLYLEPEYHLSVNPASLDFVNNGGEKTVLITSNVNWTAICSETWLNLTPASGSNNGSLVVTASLNETFDDRTAIIIVQGDNEVESKTIIVTQSAGVLNDFLEVNPTSLSFLALGGDETVQIISNVNWTATSSESWVILSPTSGNNNGSLVVTASLNQAETERTAIITVSGDNEVESKIINVSQLGASITYSLEVYPSSLNFSVNGGDETLQITSNVNWTAISSESWLTVSPASGNNDGNLTLTASPNESVEDRTAIVTVSGDNAVESKTVIILQSKASSILLVNEISNIIVYPNPSADYVEIFAGFTIRKIRLLNSLGVEVYSLNCESNQVTIPLSNLKKAQYLLEIFKEDNNVVYKKIIVQ